MGLRGKGVHVDELWVVDELYGTQVRGGEVMGATALCLKHPLDLLQQQVSRDLGAHKILELIITS